MHGGPVRPSQLEDWQNKTKNIKNFYGKEAGDSEWSWNKEISPIQKAKRPKAEKTRENLQDKINRCSSKIKQGGQSDHPLGAGDFNLNIVDDSEDGEEQEEPAGDLLDMIDLTSSDARPPLFPQQVVQPHKIGFKNYGNTCYLNASLQSLLGLPMVVRDVLNTRHLMHMLESSPSLMRAFSKLCLACTKGEMGQANQEMQEIKRVMEQLDKQFVGSKMQDASEFLCRFMDEINEDLRKVENRLEEEKVTAGEGCKFNIATSTSNMVSDNFLHEREELLRCCNCNFQTSVRHSDMSMWCDTFTHTIHSRTRSVSVQQLLEKSLAKEERERRCEECGCETAHTTSKLVKLPKVLIIYLKRYKYNQQDHLDPGGKVSRAVDIPETVCLSSMVVETVSLPSTLLPQLVSSLTVEEVAAPGPFSTPAKQHPVPVPGPQTPVKFKGLSEADLGQLSEEDQTEYLLHLSEKEALTSGGGEGDQEDKDLAAALEASMREETFNQIMSMTDPTPEAGSDEATDTKLGAIGVGDNIVGTDLRRTPARKRSFGQLGGGVFTKSGGNGETTVSKDDSKEEVKTDHDELEQPMGFHQSDRQTYSKAVKGNGDLDPQENTLRRPETKEEEEADFQRALELSAMENVNTTEDIATSQFQWAMEDTENNNSEDVSSSLVTVPGQPEHSYQLQSVVSHQGAGAASGHYVADVYRFDCGGWCRYDDTRVTRTDSLSVRTGTNTANGYIFTYIYQPLWEECQRQFGEGQ
eukprot:GFUD01030602.1.p1 GENE.GFUD01030602.1~~GFUD01030602.1.p1  ORF type:complete len:750 (+),score=252.90 GFUD01030602.1:423-2672(+)